MTSSQWSAASSTKTQVMGNRSVAPGRGRTQVSMKQGAEVKSESRT